jgi:hypothetical protein
MQAGNDLIMLISVLSYIRIRETAENREAVECSMAGFKYYLKKIFYNSNISGYARNEKLARQS